MFYGMRLLKTVEIAKEETILCLEFGITGILSDFRR